MSPEATSRAGIGMLGQGKVLRTDARTRSARGRSVSSSAAPSTGAVGGEAWSAEDADGADGRGVKQAVGGLCRGGDNGMDSTGWRSAEACEGRSPHWRGGPGRRCRRRAERGGRHELGDVAGGGEPSRCRDVAAVREGGSTDRSEGWGEAHVAEWRRVGAKRVLGDVGRGEGSCRGQAGIVVLVGVVVDRKGVTGNDGGANRCRNDGAGGEARKGGVDAAERSDARRKRAVGKGPRQRVTRPCDVRLRPRSARSSAPGCRAGGLCRRGCR